MNNVTAIGPHVVHSPPSAEDVFPTLSTSPMAVINDAGCLVSEARAVVDAITDLQAMDCAIPEALPFAARRLLDLAYERICEARPEPTA